MHPLEPAWEALTRAFNEKTSESARAARHQITYQMNQTARRLRNYRTETEWVSAVLDGVSHFAAQSAIFTFKDGRVSLCGQKGLDVAEDLSLELSSAGAFASAVESKDPVVALRTASEVGPALADAGSSERAYLFPITNGSRVVALIFAADPDHLDGNALELIGGMASAVLERQSNIALHAQIAPAATPRETNGGPAQAVSRPTITDLPAWASLSDEQRSSHIRAQRFSRVAVAEMQLVRPEACRAGREQDNLYVFLKNEIDKARETYRKQFMTIPSMVDYLHLELVRTAAEGDEHKLGADYPGQLV
ncbi:MAG: hypothetical protein JOY54_15565 [Acidobacteriaceae bacterium]|nr:hypothetical protein [Acidobacteriaceae bacterium]